LAGNRWLVAEGEFAIAIDKKTSSRTVYLLNDCMLIVKKNKSKKFKVVEWLNLASLSLFALNQDEDETRRLYAFDMFRLDQRRSISFFAKSTEEKAKWVSLIPDLQR
jgi:hypothetical protein